MKDKRASAGPNPRWRGSLASAIVRRSSQDPRRAHEFLLHSLLSGQRRAVDRVAKAFIDLAQAAKRVAATFRGGGRLIYLGAGSSGLLAMQDGMELPGTFGVEAKKIRSVTPNGERLLVDGSAENDARLTEKADPLADTAIARSAGLRASASIARTTQNFAPARKRSSRGSLAAARRLRRRHCGSSRAPERARDEGQLERGYEARRIRRVE